MIFENIKWLDNPFDYEAWYQIYGEENWSFRKWVLCLSNTNAILLIFVWLKTLVQRVSQVALRFSRRSREKWRLLQSRHPYLRKRQVWDTRNPNLSALKIGLRFGWTLYCFLLQGDWALTGTLRSSEEKLPGYKSTVFQIWSGSWYVTFDGDDGAPDKFDFFLSSSYRRLGWGKEDFLILLNNLLIQGLLLDIVGGSCFAFCLNQMIGFHLLILIKV